VSQGGDYIVVSPARVLACARPVGDAPGRFHLNDCEETLMRMLLHVKMPPEKFNAAVKDGTVGAKIKRILDDLKPEMIYFTEHQGHRGAIMIVNLENPSDVPKFAEPWFLTFDADCQYRIVMTPEDLGKAGLDALGKKWA
jgi:hypothetical protein